MEQVTLKSTLYSSVQVASTLSVLTVAPSYITLTKSLQSPATKRISLDSIIEAGL